MMNARPNLFTGAARCLIFLDTHGPSTGAQIAAVFPDVAPEAVGFLLGWAVAKRYIKVVGGHRPEVSWTEQIFKLRREREEGTGPNE
jgi:hypothetical protein